MLGKKLQSIFVRCEIAVFASAIFLAGCNREEIKTYSIPKEKAASPMAMAHSDLSGEPNTHLHWTLPEGWQELAPTQTRVGNFLINGKNGKKVEVTIIPFPGSVGGDLENVNRWRGEIGLEPITQKGLDLQKISIGSSEGKLVELSGENSATVAAFLLEDGTSWFFKMRGDKELVAESKPDFINFLKTILFDKTEHTDAQPVAPPVSTNVKEVPSETPAPIASLKQEDDVPPSWKAQPAAPMVLKSFSIDGKATVAISAFPGDVGGALANVNRWRRQLGLEPIEESELPKLTSSIDVLGGKAMLVDMKGTDSKTSLPAQMIAATVRRGEKSWFYKLMGDEKIVAREKDAFIKYVQNVRYTD